MNEMQRDLKLYNCKENMQEFLPEYLFIQRHSYQNPKAVTALLSSTLDFKKQQNGKKYSSLLTWILYNLRLFFFLNSTIKTRLHKFLSLLYVFYSVPVHKTYTKPYGWKNKAMEMNYRYYRKKQLIFTNPPKPSKIQKT